jgi:hypothetical protein
MPNASAPLNAEALIHDLCQEYQQRFLKAGISAPDTETVLNRTKIIAFRILNLPGSGPYHCPPQQEPLFLKMFFDLH